MTNRAFLLKSDVDRQKKLTVLLRNRTNDALSFGQLDTILNSIQLDRQYSIIVHNDPEMFEYALVLVNSHERRDKGKILFGQAKFCISKSGSSKNGQLITVHNSAAAVIVRYADTFAEHHTIHIYVPQHNYEKRKVAQYEKGYQEKNCL